jgi:predicted SAM-dependent methyltransferase
MRISDVLKHTVKRPSARRRLQNVRSAIRDLWADVTNEFKFGNDLRNHCRGKTELLLNVGCGEIIQRDWVNIDFDPKPGAFYFNALNPLPLDDGSVRRIHAEHFLEHLDYTDVVRFLSESKRILAKGGTMRIVVPDAERYMRAYASSETAFFAQLKDLGGASEPLPTNDAICNQMFRMGGDHRFAWDFETLEFVTRQVGFDGIRRSHFADRSIPYCIDAKDWWRPVESLYAELTK